MQILVHYQILIYRSGILHLRKYQEILSISRKDKVWNLKIIRYRL